VGGVAIYEGTESACIAATPAECFEAMIDFEALPGWQRARKRCEVISRDEAGLGHEVLYEVDARVKTVSYRLEHFYERPHVIHSRYLGGDFRDFSGDWRFEEISRGTRAVVSIGIDPGLRLPGRLVRLVNDRVLAQSLRDLKRHLEG